MLIKILGTAANWSKPFKIIRQAKSAGIKNFTSCYFKTDSCFQIDAGNKWQKERIDYLLITHLHKDHIKEIKNYPKEIKFLIPDKSFLRILPAKSNTSILKRGKSNPIKKTIIEPFTVHHSKTTLTVGYKITYQRHSFIWIPDFFSFPSYNFLKGTDTWFIDSSSFDKNIHPKNTLFGHRSISNFLKECQKRKIKPKSRVIYLIHIGVSMFPLRKRIKQLQQKFPDYIIKPTKDGEVIKIPSPQTSSLSF